MLAPKALSNNECDEIIKEIKNSEKDGKKN